MGRPCSSFQTYLKLGSFALSPYFLLPSPPAARGRGVGGEGAEMLDTFVNRGLDQAPYTPWILRYLVSRYPQQSVAFVVQLPLSTTHRRQSSL
jgi:hypothetical protein